MCRCKNIKMGTFKNQSYYVYKGRLIGIDNCILDEIKSIQSKGIETAASCCGHNVIESNVGVYPEFIEKMKALGYENDLKNYPHRKDIFLLKENKE
jgi:hypothetical protein